MQCPHCHRSNIAGAQRCVFCGAALQPADARNAADPWAASSVSVAPSGGASGDWRESSRSGTYAADEQVLPPWRVPSPGQSGQMPSVGSSGPPASVQPGPLPAPSQPPDRTPHPRTPSVLPGGTVLPLMGNLSGPGRSSSDASGTASAPGRSDMFGASSFALSPATSVQRAPRGTGGLVPALSPGMLLKAGRYSLLQRYYSSAALEPQGSEPPLMIASDSEFPDQRVLVQEVLLEAEWPDDAERVRRAIAGRLQAVAHSGGIASLVDHFGEQRRHFLVFELPTGETLLDRLHRSRGPMAETAAVSYALQVLDVLEHFERERPPFIHGNLSPANIILRPSGQVALLGFSTALLMHPDGVLDRRLAGGVLGYAAPEQLRGQPNPRSDLYALCAVLHHAVTGTPPAARPTAPHSPARHLNPKVSLELEEVTGRGLRPAANQRYESAAELRDALQPLASGRLATHVPDDLNVVSEGAIPAIAPVRDVRGRLVLPRRRASQNPLVLIGALLCLLVVIGAGALYAVVPHAPGTAGIATATPNTLAALFQSKGIGLSGGEYIFDTQRGDNTEKQHASLALASNDARGALADFQTAESVDQSDAEAAIYAADLQIQLAGEPYVTVVAAVAFGGDSDVGMAREELQGIYLAQQRIDSVAPLPGDTKVRVLILNSGADAADASTASAVLLREIQNGNAQHLVGIVGWPESDQTRMAISSLAPSGLAIVSPTADADGLGGAAGNFFAMAPSLSNQAQTLATAMVNQLAAHNILVLGDPHDSVSDAQATAFLSRISASTGPPSARATRANFSTDATTNFDATVQAAITAGDDWIFLAGSTQDSIYLAQSVAKLNARYGTALRVLVTTSADTPALFGVGSNPAAQLAQHNPEALRWLSVASLADKGEWTSASVDASPPSYFDDYAAEYGPSGQPFGLPNPDPTSILSYDATQVLLAAEARGAKVVGGQEQMPSPTDVRQRLLQFTAGSPFGGVGGAIAFNLTGGQPDKSLAILALTPVRNPGPSQPIVVASVEAVAGGRAAFCGGVGAKCAAN